MKLSLFSLFTISLMLATTIGLSAEFIMIPIEAAFLDLAGQTTVSGRFW